MPDILIRGISDELAEKLAHEAERNRRSREKHALFLIEQGLEVSPADTCGELADRLEKAPLPDVNEQLLETFSARRKRRSPRT
jgi:hypothetical protein